MPSWHWQCSIHPYLFNERYNGVDGHIIINSCKFMVFKIIQEFSVEKGEGVIIFSNFGSVLSLCEELQGTSNSKTLDSNRRDSMVGRHMHGDACWLTYSAMTQDAWFSQSLSELVERAWT